MFYYLDTSAWIAWKFGQNGKELLAKVLLKQNTVLSSPLLVAEYLAFLKKTKQLENVRYEDDLEFIRWIYPADSLIESCAECARCHYLRGADLYHLATALWFAQGLRKDLRFLTCDIEQARAAQKIGFKL